MPPSTSLASPLILNVSVQHEKASEQVFLCSIHLLCIIQIIISLTHTYMCLSTWNWSASYYYLERRERIIPLLNSWTKSDNIVGCARASKGAVLIISSMTISLRTLLLKDTRIVCGWTWFWGAKWASATILWLIKSNTGALASKHAAIRPFHLQLCWANRVHVGWTAWGLAFTGAASSGYRNRQVEAIYKTNIVEVYPTPACYADFY